MEVILCWQCDDDCTDKKIDTNTQGVKYYQCVFRTYPPPLRDQGSSSIHPNLYKFIVVIPCTPFLRVGRAGVYCIFSGSSLSTFTGAYEWGCTTTGDTHTFLGIGNPPLVVGKGRKTTDLKGCMEGSSLKKKQRGDSQCCRDRVHAPSVRRRAYRVLYVGRF